jgi:hypothetical protein
VSEFTSDEQRDAYTAALDAEAEHVKRQIAVAEKQGNEERLASAQRRLEEIAAERKRAAGVKIAAETRPRGGARETG